jgi:MFS family permease
MERDDAVNTPSALNPISEASQQIAAADELVADAIEEERIPRVGAGFIFVYGFTYFGFFLVLFMPALFSVAYKVQLIDAANKEASLGLIIGVGALASAILGPVFGVLSDGSRFAWGRRRPFLVLGLLLAAGSALVIAIAPNVVVVLLGWVVAQAAASSISAAMNPTLPERVPLAQRGKLGALSGVAASIAGVCATLVGSFLTGSLVLLFLVPVGVFALGVVLWLFVVPDGPAPAAVGSRSVLAALRSLLFDPRKHRDFAWVWIGKFCLQIGTAFFTTYQLYFLLDRLGYTPEEAGRQLAVAGGIALLATIGFTVAGGFISDRLRRRKPFIYIAAGMIATGMILAAIAPDFLVYVIGGTLLAAGTGAFNSVDLALAADVLPDKAESGKWMSIYNLSGSLSSAAGPVIAPALLFAGSATANYTLLFIFGGVLALGASITASRVRGAR